MILRDSTALERNRADGRDLFAPIVVPDWTVDALCAQTFPDAFFPEKGGSAQAAKRVCAGCPVSVECLAYAFEINDPYGIYGGMAARERRALTRKAAA